MRHERSKKYEGEKHTTSAGVVAAVAFTYCNDGDNSSSSGNGNNSGGHAGG